MDFENGFLLGCQGPFRFRVPPVGHFGCEFVERLESLQTFERRRNRRRLPQNAVPIGVMVEGVGTCSWCAFSAAIEDKSGLPGRLTDSCSR